MSYCDLCSRAAYPNAYVIAGRMVCEACVPSAMRAERPVRFLNRAARRAMRRA